MRRSRSQYIVWASIPLSDLFKQAPGTPGLYIPAPDEQGRINTSIAKISSAAKSLAVRHKKKCLINTLLVLKQEQDNDLPIPSKMVQIVITDDLSPVGQRYVEANPHRRRKRKSSRRNDNAPA